LWFFIVFPFDSKTTHAHLFLHSPPKKNIWSLGRGQHHCDEEDMYIYIIKNVEGAYIYVYIKKIKDITCIDAIAIKAEL
jgi:hypothetical protein